jgi:tetratricopeptide (TPR) repeat protein
MRAPFDRINEARTRKQWDELESCARELLAQEPNDIYAIQLVGETLEKRGRVEEALQYYEKALGIDSEGQHSVGHTHFLKRLDILYHQTGRYGDCLRVCEYYTSRHPDSWDAWNRLKRAAKKTGKSELSAYAKSRADEIKSSLEAARRASEARYQQWKALYGEKLREMGFEPVTPADRLAEAHKSPPPSLDAPEEEWGKWLQETTDFDRLEAEIQAGHYATVELERRAREERLGPPRKMTPEQRYRTILNGLTELKTGNIDTIIFSDREVNDNYVQLTEEICEVSSRAWPGSKLPPLDKEQEDALKAMGFSRPDDSDHSPNYVMNHLNLSIEQLANIVKEAFEIIGSPQNFEIVVEGWQSHNK